MRIAGLDEVGRGPLFGPVWRRLVILPGLPPAGLTDSKKLSEKKRTEFDRGDSRECRGLGNRIGRRGDD